MTAKGQHELRAGSEQVKTRLLHFDLAVIPKKGLATGEDLLQFPLYWLKVELDSEATPQTEGAIQEQFAGPLSAVLCDPLLENLWISPSGAKKDWAEKFLQVGYRWFGERQFLPGVTDNLARTVEEALALVLKEDKAKKGAPKFAMASGAGFLFADLALTEPGQIAIDQQKLEAEAKYVFYHPLSDCFVVHDLTAIYNRYLSFPSVHLPEPEPVETISLDLDDNALQKLSRDRLLALSLEEMKALATYFAKDEVIAGRRSSGLSANLTDVELEVIAQTWSEHCKHKIFAADIEHTEYKSGNPNPERLSVRSLYKTFIQKPTKEMMAEHRDDLLSVFEDNSGVVAWDDKWAVCFKVETHNSPSALEPYGGALTGILGVNRDVLGTGLGAKPIFNTDVFCFAYPSALLAERPKLLPAHTIMQGVRRGVQDGGNKSGIPTVNGAIVFHPGYRAKPLVFCGTGGLLPREIGGRSSIAKHTKVGDRIVMVGGRVGKDGIHGATFSSEALHEGSPVSAVQIGDPFTQKRMIDFVLAARDAGLLTGITDNGAGGLSSSVGEMARLTNGAVLVLDDIPLKYPGLRSYEIVISESQERMTISTDSLPELRELAEKFNVELTDVGEFCSDGFLRIYHQNKLVAYLDLEFLHEGVPRMSLRSQWKPVSIVDTTPKKEAPLKTALLNLLTHPNISSRETVIRQYDHEVQGSSVLKPLMGPKQKAPCDAAVILPLLSEDKGLVVSNGICPQYSRFDASLMAKCAVDEAMRNLVAVGADPGTVVLLDNFCWPDPISSPLNPEGEQKLAQLVMCCRGLADICRAYKAPLISGKDSMKNDFDDGVVRLSIPPTLLVSAMAKIPSASKAQTMEFKQEGDILYLLSAASISFAGSSYSELYNFDCSLLPCLDEAQAYRMYQCIHKMIMDGAVQSAHDLSEGGLAVSTAEACIGSGFGANISASALADAAKYSAKLSDMEELRQLAENALRMDFCLFAEGPGRMLLSVKAKEKSKFETAMADFSCVEIGRVTKDPYLRLLDDRQTSDNPLEIFSVSVTDLEKAWETALPFD